MKYIQVNLTQQHRDNLFKLAGYLLNLPKNYRHFDMSVYYSVDHTVGLIINAPFQNKKLTECGAVACALGHSVDAGFKPIFCSGAWGREGERRVEWSAMSAKYFGIKVFDGSGTTNTAWDWCFGSCWKDSDNTPQGAGMRISWLLANGLPEKWSYSKPCYL